MPRPNARHPAATEANTARCGVGVGLARVLSKMGIASRTAATVLIEAGRVSVNGQVLRNPEARINMSRDRIALDNTPLSEIPKRYIAINKPRGLVTTASDERGRATVYTCLGEDEQRAWLAPVGRLDKASEGLILFTNDTAWAQRILDPASHLPKTYHVQVSRLLSEDEVAQLQHGVVLAVSGCSRASMHSQHSGILPSAHHCDVHGNTSVAGERSEGFRMPGATAHRTRASTVQGCTSAARGRMPKAACPPADYGVFARAERARVLRSGQKNCWLEIVLHQGIHRQIRRMLAVLDTEVLRLIRVAIGPVTLGTLPKGQSRPLTEDELTRM